ncbi:MAG: tetratricopeptide repeat protein [bacterium]
MKGALSAGCRRRCTARAAAVCIVSILLFGLLLLPGTYAQESEPDDRAAWDGEDYLSAVEAAIRAERYDRAVDLLDEGKERFPDYVPLYLRAGDLYRDEELYEMALQEYRRAEDLEPESYQALHGQSVALGRLNREREAIVVLEELLELYPDSIEVISDLGWMYFKTHQLAKGEELLSGALDRLGMNRSLAMTLATVYADMYDYEKAKRHYEMAIQDALQDGRSYFASVAQYNLSLVEKTFYNFEDALESTEESLRLARRPPGLLARGELQERRMRFSDALADYNAAYSLDEETPLAKVSLASLHQNFGRLEQALAYAKDVYEADSSSWMFNFGTDVNRHGMDIHGLMADIHEGLHHEARFENVSGIGEWLDRLVRRVGYRIQAWFHRRNERMFARRVAEAYKEEGSSLNANWTFYRAYEDYPGKASTYLDRAREFETALIPDSRGFYELRAGALRGDLSALMSARDDFDPTWERLELAEAARERARIHKREGSNAAYAQAIRELYTLNPGGLRQYGLFLPVKLELSMPALDATSHRRLTAALGRAGLVPSSSSEEAAFRLVVTGYSDGVIAGLYDEDSLVRSERHTLEGVSRRSLARLSTRIAAGVFAVQ